MLDPQTIEFDLNPLEPTSGTDVRLTVTEGNGIGGESLRLRASAISAVVFGQRAG